MRGLVRRITLEALQRGIGVGTIEAAWNATRAWDPLLRGAAKARVRQALAEAGRSSAVQQPEHLLRLAYLLVAGSDCVSDYDDVSAVAAAQETLAAELHPVRQGWRYTWMLVAGLVPLFVVGVGAAVLLRSFDARSSTPGRILAEVLPSLVEANSRWSPESVEAARRLVTTRDAKNALGEDAAAKLERMIDATLAVTGVAADEGGVRQQDAYSSAVHDFNQALAARELPYFVDSQLIVGPDGVTPLLLSFYVQRKVVVQSGAKQVPVLHLWRLDRLAAEHGALGFTRPRTPAALVLLDAMEEDLIRYVLPAVPPREPLWLVDDDTADSQVAWSEALAAKGGELVRRYVAALPEADRLGLGEVGRLMALRRALVQKWQRIVPRLPIPARFIPERDYESRLDLKVPRAQLREWTEIHETLRRPEILAAFSRFRDRYVTSVQRHEVQHRLDFDRGLIPVPPVVQEMFGVENPLGVETDSMPGRVRDELSAYLASIARAPDSPRLDVLLLGRHLLNVYGQGGIYWYTALAAMRVLAQQLGIDGDGITGRVVSRPEAARLVAAVADASDAQLCQAALDGYRVEWGRLPEDVRVVSQHDNPTWRH